jgi:aminoacrylate hydrolase
VRCKLLAESDRDTVFSCYACFLFSPRYSRENPDIVQAWIDRLVAHPETPGDREIALKRVDMITAHDTVSRLGEIKQPALVVCGSHDFCVPPQLSEEIAAGIPGSRPVIIDGAGHLVENEKDAEFFELVSSFIDGV